MRLTPIHSLRHAHVIFALLFTDLILPSEPQYNRRHRFDCHRLEGQPTTTRHDRDCHQRTDDNERIPDREGEDAAKDGTAVVEFGLCFAMLCHSRCVLDLRCHLSLMMTGAWLVILLVVEWIFCHRCRPQQPRRSRFQTLGVSISTLPLMT